MRKLLILSLILFPSLALASTTYLGDENQDSFVETKGDAIPQVRHIHQYQTVDLGGGSSGTNTAFSINDDGQIAGIISDAAHNHGFVWQSGVMKILSAPAGTNSFAWGINYRGQVVGGSIFIANPGGAAHATLWDGKKESI